MDGHSTQQRTTYRCSAYWDFNVSGALVGGAGGALLMITVFLIILWGTGFTRGILIWFAVLLASFVGTAIAFYPGNLVATFPIAVEFEEGKGLRLIAPLKKLYIPFDEIKEVRDSTLWQVFQQGIVVRLNKRHGLLKSFAIHWAFGAEGRQLARAIQQEIARRTP